MASTIDYLKSKARVIHRLAQSGDEATLKRFDLHEPVQRRHCLKALSVALGFSGWQHLHATLSGESDDFGTLLRPQRCWVHWNIWSADYNEAQQIRREHGGFLLPWKRQFIVVDADYVDELGLDPTDPDWDAINRDWVRPQQMDARDRLYAKLVELELNEMPAPS